MPNTSICPECSGKLSTIVTGDNGEVSSYYCLSCKITFTAVQLAIMERLNNFIKNTNTLHKALTEIIEIITPNIKSNKEKTYDVVTEKEKKEEEGIKKDCCSISGDNIPEEEE